MSEKKIAVDFVPPIHLECALCLLSRKSPVPVVRILRRCVLPHHFPAGFLFLWWYPKRRDRMVEFVQDFNEKNRTSVGGLLLPSSDTVFISCLSPGLSVVLLQQTKEVGNGSMWMQTSVGCLRASSLDMERLTISGDTLMWEKAPMQSATKPIQPLVVK